ncbi:hypothetical protein ACLD0W_12745 [Alloalcanivorax sp. C16-1]|uniref:hypothetical protein n=1 Tax=Alloalcanivorax sp. C16-1 TaxID=3390051 RepID=UPI003970F6FA
MGVLELVQKVRVGESGRISWDDLYPPTHDAMPDFGAFQLDFRELERLEQQRIIQIKRVEREEAWPERPVAAVAFRRLM